MSQRPPRALPQNLVAQLFRGLAYPLEGLGFIRRNRLWGLTTMAIGVNVVLLAGLIGFSLYVTIPWLEHVDQVFAGIAGESGFLHGIMSAIGWVIWILALGLAVAASGLFLLLIGQTVASPFLDLLSERVEVLVLGIKPTPFGIKRLIEGVVVALGDLVWGVCYLALIHIPILIIGATGIGAIPAAIASFCFSAWLLAHEFIGLALSRQLVGYRARWRVVWRNKGLGLGFGTACMGLMLVPGLNLVLLPLAAVGGTLLYCDLRSSGRLHLDTESERRSALAV
jgi:CysZ protein